ncbi:MAG: Tn3 family transposase, partial [Chloroflexi bacterium]|nr:Tn3 family transposase [Chloroflexota bacterium]
MRSRSITQTPGAFTDQIFGICQLLGFRYAPRIRDLADKRLHPFEKASSYPALDPLVGDRINVGQIETQWDELLRLATSIRQGTVTASLVLRKLASYPRQNGLAWGLRELGRIDRTLFMLEWLQNPELRRRVTIGMRCHRVLEHGVPRTGGGHAGRRRLGETRRAAA